jgi:hypothetical protein
MFDWSDLPVEASRVDVELRAVLRLAVDILDVDEWPRLSKPQRTFLERAKALGIVATDMVWRCDICSYSTVSEDLIRAHDETAHI